MDGADPSQPRDQPASVRNDFSGDTQTALQAGAIYGGVHVYPSAPAVGRPPAPSYPNPWAELAGKHEVWKRTADSQGLLPTVVEIAGALHDRWQELTTQLAGDPWLDHEFAKRMSTRLSELVRDLESPLRFSPLEAALLAITPLVHQVWSLEAVVALLDVGPTDLRPRTSTGPRRDYERFLSGPEQSRLVNRAGLTDLDGRGGPAARNAISWWLFRQWVRSLPQDQTTRWMPVDDPPLRKALVSTTKKLTQLFQFTPGQLRDGDNRGHLSATATYPGITDDVDEERLGFLLLVAHEQAIDIMRLPATLVEHLGIPRPIDLTQLRTTVRQARWKPTETGIGLVAHCHHEAVLESLRDHVGRVTAVLAAVHAVAVKATNLEPLRRLPVAVSTDFIEAARDEDDEPVFIVPVTRFQLDESRIRELLMGEQLYGDRSLAIRELYQNALDACRWRRARYESGVPGQPREWTGGRIDFVQQEENGRHILRCTDTGVGMGESDLREVFSRAGVRFTERREFRKEEAEWEGKGVRFFPNSRFGIGVLSYFMLADEIEVRTRRMNRHGGSEPALRVLIAGPGHLFHIEHLDEDQPIGTSVTLYLREGATAASCLEVLQRCLGIAEFDTYATHDGIQDVWKRAEFTARTERTGDRGGIGVTGAVVLGDATEDGQVVWCETGGGLLVDGIHVNLPNKSRSSGEVQITNISGAIVNLTGSRAPRLTVDRAMVQEDVTQQVSTLMSAAVPRLLEAAPSFLNFDWLCSVADATPAVANALTSAAAEADLQITTFSEPMKVRITGCLPVDRKLVDGLSTPSTSTGPTARQENLSDSLLLWRLLAHRGHHALTGYTAEERDMLPALPTDELLINWSGRFVRPQPTRIPPGHVVNMAFAMNADPAAVVDRLAALGHDVSDLGPFPDRHSLTPTDVTLLSRDLDGEDPWLDPSEPIPLGHVIAAHRATGIPGSEIVRRLKEYSFRTRYLIEDMPHFTYQDEFLVSIDVDGEAPWLDHKDTVDLRHVFLAASVSRRNLSDVVDRLTELRFTVAKIERPPNWFGDIRPGEFEVLRGEPMLRADGKVAPVWVVHVAAAWGIPPQEAAQRLADMAYVVPGDDELPKSLNTHDAELLIFLFGSRRVGEGGSVSRHSLIRVATLANRTPSDTAATLVALGFDVPSEMAQAHELDEPDRWLMDNLPHDWENPRDALRPMIEAARMFRMSLAGLTERLDRLGYADLVSRAIPPDQSIPLALALAIAHEDGQRPYRVLSDLIKRGFPISPAEPHAGWYDAVNTTLVAALGREVNVSVRDVIEAALKHDMTIDEVVRRFDGLGLEVPDMAAELPKLLARVPFRPEAT